MSRYWIWPVLVAGLATGTPADQHRAPDPQTFRATTTLMALEVRVVDQKGKPVAGLTKADFQIFENGVRQDLSHFIPVLRTADAELATEALGVIPAGTRPADVVSPRRIFLIVLGRGNLQIPSKGLDGMIHLVGRLLLPQDQVAVMAWNRATPFTTNHEQVAEMLERYRAGYRQVDALLAQHFSGLAAIYGSRDIPERVQREIEAVLRWPGALETRAVIPGEIDAGLAGRVRRETDALMGTPSLDAFGESEADRIGMSLDDYASTRVQSMQDLTRIYAGIAYLSHLDGEKHLVFVSPTGLHLPSTDDDRTVARAAQDARVVIDIFHADGMSAGIWAVASSKNIAEFTGGQFTGLTYGDRFAERIDAATRTAYQLGYYPTNPVLDGKYRKVTVKVNRGGATALYRHGYYGRNTLVTLDRRQVVSQSRVEAALRYGGEVRDLKLTATATRGKDPTGKLQIIVQISLAPDGVGTTRWFNEHRASLDVAVVCADRGRYIVGTMWKQVDLRMTEESHAEFLRSGVGFTVHVPLRRSASDCKAVVYDDGADRVGTVVPKIK